MVIHAWQREAGMRKTSLLIVLALMALVAPGSPARAGDETHCVSAHDGTISPGLSIEPSSGTGRLSGDMQCHGPVNGQMPTGVGTYSEEARYGTEDPDTCQDGGEGTGVFVTHIPTAGGDQVFTLPCTFVYGDLTTNPGAVTGTFVGDGVRGTFKITPTKGDCVTAPVTAIHVNADFYFAQ
jgi:hypothetical protein